MNLTGLQIGIGALAGIAAALLSVGVASGSALGLATYLVSPLPLMAAGLGWGFPAAVAGAVSAAAFAAFAISGSFVAILSAITLFPALAGVWYLALARPAEEIGGPAGKLAWFPLADTLLRMAVAVALGFIAIGVMVGYGPEFVRANVGEMIALIRAIDPQFQPAAGFEESLTRLIGAVLPYFHTGFWTMATVGNLYLAARLARSSGRLSRPADDWPQTLRLPQSGLFTFGAALALSLLLPGGYGNAAAAVAGVTGGVFAMAGMARLHAATRGNPARPLILFAGYAAAGLIQPVLVAFVVAGLLQTGRSIVISEATKSPNPKSTN